MGGQKVLLAQRFLTEIVEAHPDVPVTFALTPGDLDPALGGNATPRSLVGEIWAAPNVEASVASYTRPYRWSFFEDYSREKELAVATAARPKAFRANTERTKERSTGADTTPWSVGAAAEYPRNYIARPFSLVRRSRAPRRRPARSCRQARRSPSTSGPATPAPANRPWPRLVGRASSR